ncbi:hypothetical protein [Nostoc sp.]|uniref:hypothetical protein n=1 Tax=Nostoc sp. TaxID=1180 RepID=UPI002FFA468A
MSNTLISSTTRLQPVWIGGNLKPTRSNVLDPSVIDVLLPGSLVFSQNPAYKKDEIEHNFKDIDVSKCGVDLRKLRSHQNRHNRSYRGLRR